MSNAFLTKFGTKGHKKSDMRKWCQRPGKKGKDGKPIYFTEQHHKKECDVNLIIKKYDTQGVLSHVNTMEARFGDVTGADFRKAQDLFIQAKNSFESLPSEIKKRFQNDAGQFLEFMEDENNREEAIKLGLIRGDTPEDKDGLGEHVKPDDYDKEKEEEAA